MKYFAAIAIASLITASSPLPLHSANENVEALVNPLAKQMIGTWILVGTPGNVKEAPAKGGRLKFFTGKNWIITQANADTGVVIFHHGGTYTLTGDKFAETLEYANESTKHLIGKVHNFTIKIDGDTYTQTAVDNEFTEVWKRVK